MTKLILIQSELKVPKTNVNSFGKYKYRSCEDILEELKPLLKKHECKVTLSDKIVAIGNKFFLRSKAIFSDGENIEVSKGFAELSEHKGMSSEQATGTASSYARKYALNGLFLIDETAMDADSVNDKKQQYTPPIKKPNLIVATKEYNGCVAAMSILNEKTGQNYSIADFRLKYEISADVEKLLIEDHNFKTNPVQSPDSQEQNA